MPAYIKKQKEFHSKYANTGEGELEIAGFLFSVNLVTWVA